jgi:hypothetical protein
MNRLKLTIVFLNVLVLTSVAFISCDNSSTPLIHENTSLTLEEKSLPPVFSDINLLRGEYRETLHFSNGYSQLVFGSLPRILEAEFAELSVNSTLPVVPEELIAYKVIRPVVDETYAYDLSQRIGFSDPPQFYDTDKTYRVYDGDPYDDNSPVFSVYQDGTIVIYYTRIKQQALSLPSDQECIDIARKWLESCDLYPKNVIDIKTSADIMHIMRGSTESQYTAGTSVSFIIGLDGYELFGMGAHFLIGENGKVLEVHINAPEFESYCYVRVRKPDLVLNTFQNYLNNPPKFRADTPECLISNINRYILVNNVSLKYFSMISADDNVTAYAQPVYVLEGVGRNKSELSWDHLTAAIDAVSR